MRAVMILPQAARFSIVSDHALLSHEFTNVSAGSICLRVRKLRARARARARARELTRAFDNTGK